MAEQLGLEEALGDGRAVDRDERPVFAGAEAVDGPSHQLLARAALALDQHREIRGRRALGHVEDALERLALADQVLEAARRLPFPEGPHLHLQASPVEGAGDHDLELGHLEGLGEEVVGSARDRIDGDLPRAVGRHHDDGRLRGEITDARNGVETVHVGKPDVQQDEIVLGGLEPVEERAGRGRHLGLIALTHERLADHEREVFVVLRDQDLLAHGFAPTVITGALVGSSTTKLVSDLPSLSTMRVPRCASTICRAMGNPNPVPRAFVVKNGWKMRS